MSALIKYITENEAWEDELVTGDYSLKIRTNLGLHLFMYNQIKSKFNNELVCESRGIIVDTNGNVPRIVCRAFDKFFNNGESYAAPVNFNDCRVLEKLDGSIMKVWFFDDKWRVSTNGTINAYEAPLNGTDMSFGDLFEEAANESLNYKNLDPEYTYIFELVSPKNHIVVEYDKTELFHIGTRHNETGVEIKVDIGIKKPKSYELKSVEECKEFLCNVSGLQQEGFVVVDSYYKRIKIKSLSYIMYHHLRGQQVDTEILIFICIIKNETEEMLAVNKNLVAKTEAMTIMIKNFKDNINAISAKINPLWTKKEVAKYTKMNSPCPSINFKLSNKQIESVDKYIEDIVNMDSKTRNKGIRYLIECM